MADTATTVGSIAQILAAIARERAQGRVDTAGINQNQGRAEADIFRTRMDAALKGPALSAQQTAQGDTMANIKPFAWTGQTQQVGNLPVPQSTGGLTPANFGPATRQAGADLARVAGGRVTSPSFNLPDPPKLAPLPQSSLLDKILGAGGALGALGGIPGAGGDIGKLLKALADKMRGSPSVQRNKPYPGGALMGGGQDRPGFLGFDYGPDYGPTQDQGPELTGDVDTDQWLGQWPERPGDTGDPIDPSQFGNSNDVLQEYYDWLASQGGGDGMTYDPYFDPADWY